MATILSSTTNNDTALENFVKCAICLDIYDDPRLLPCSHTFCYKCIKKLCENDMGQCPMRDNSIIFKQTIDQLPINRVAKDLVESLHKSSSSQSQCGSCQQTLSEFHCQTCSKYYCTICLKLEHNLNKFQTHVIHLLINDNFNRYCKQHMEDKLKYWCENCEEMVCSDCLLFQHKQHSFISLIDLQKKIQLELQSSIKQIDSMKENIDKLNNNTSKALQNHYETHLQAKRNVEQTFENLQTLLDKRKTDLINQITTKDYTEQQMIREEKNHIESFFKTLLIRELLLKQLLKCEDSLQLIEMNDDIINYNQFIEEQYQQFLQGHTFDLQYFVLGNSLEKFQQQMETFGDVSIDTFLNDINHIRPSTKLSQIFGEEKSQEFDEIYAYGYRFDLKTSIEFNAVRIKAKLADCNVTILILDHNDILREKKLFISSNNTTTMDWITISMKCQIEHNYCLLLWTKSNEKHIPMIAYKDSDHNLRQINEQISIRSKRAEINPSKDLNLNSKINVLYDALYTTDDQSEKAIPALEMILYI